MSYSYNKRKQNIKTYEKYINPKTGEEAIAIRGKKSIRDREASAEK